MAALWFDIRHPQARWKIRATARRLACQIVLGEDLDVVSVIIPAGTRYAAALGVGVHFHPEPLDQRL